MQSKSATNAGLLWQQAKYEAIDIFIPSRSCFLWCGTIKKVTLCLVIRLSRKSMIRIFCAGIATWKCVVVFFRFWESVRSRRKTEVKWYLILYNDTVLSDTSYIASDILCYQIILHCYPLHNSSVRTTLVHTDTGYQSHSWR